MKNILIAVIVLIAIGFFGWKLMGNRDVTSMPAANPSSENTDTSAATSSSNVIATTTPLSVVKEFTVTGQNFSFSPSTLSVNKGDKVRITFKNSGGTHDWVIDEFNARTQRISGGQTETIEFTADKTGTFEYYCSVGTHRQMGMKGALTVH